MRRAFGTSTIMRVAFVAASGSLVASSLFAQGSGAVRRRVPGDTTAPTKVMIRQRSMDSTTHDSLARIIISLTGDDVGRMIAELIASRQMEERLAITLRGERADSRSAKELETQLAALTRKNAVLSSTIRLQCASEEAQPEGYMGINFEGIEMQRRNGGPTMYFLGERPTIVSVEPGSPAQRAGLEADDQVTAIAGNDARKPFALGALLKPGAKLSLRVLRDGKARDVTVNVEKRPGEYGSPCAGADDVVSGFRFSPQTSFMKRFDGPMVGALPRSPNPDGAQPSREGFAYGFVTPFAMGGANVIAGATFVILDADWREALGADKGLLVVAVAQGSPAQTVGLKKSDVVLSVGDTPVASPGALWRAVNDAGKDGVTLKLLRARKEISIVLKPRDGR